MYFVTRKKSLENHTFLFIKEIKCFLKGFRRPFGLLLHRVRINACVSVCVSLCVAEVV